MRLKDNYIKALELISDEQLRAEMGEKIANRCFVNKVILRDIAECGITKECYFLAELLILDLERFA